MPIICMFRRMRYIPDMGLATMRTGCGRNKTYAPSGSQQQPLTGPKKTPYMPVGHIRSFLWSKSVCAGSRRPPVFSRSIRKGTEVSLCLPRTGGSPFLCGYAGPYLAGDRGEGGGNTLRSGQRGRSGGMPGKKRPPLYPILGKGVRPLCPALPEGNTLLYPTF